MFAFLRQNPLVSFFAITILLSWAIYIPLVFVRQGWMEAQIPYSIHYFASFGPMTAAIIITAVTGRRKGLRELWGRIIRWRVPWQYAAFATLSPIALFILAAVAMRLAQGEWPDLRLLGQVNYLPYLGWAVLPIWIVSFGFGEEIGWRGFALPRLQKTMSVSKATLILGLLWFLRHASGKIILNLPTGAKPPPVLGRALNPEAMPTPASPTAIPDRSTTNHR